MSPQPEEKKKVLIIDDDEDDRWLFSEALSRTAPFIECITASDGHEALNLLMDETTSLPDLIFLDLNMPGLDGKKCLTLLKGNPRLKEIPVIIYSTSNFYKDIEESQQLGAVDFIIKPTDYNKLCALFHSMFIEKDYVLKSVR